MKIAEKKMAAALAAVQAYLEQEEAEARAAAAAANSQVAYGQGNWAQSGRMAMMGARRMVQMRAFPGA